MQLFVERPVGTRISLDVGGGDTIEEIKQKIEDKKGIPSGDQTLFFNDIKLEDQFTLSHYNIQKESTIQLRFVTLPVLSLNFTAKIFDHYTEINWSTVSESNNAEFIIAHSSDGKAFTEISRKKATGNSSQLKNYTFKDHNVNTGKNYYRLSQVDLDGKITKLGFRSVNFAFADEENISVYPNPIAKIINISSPNYSGNTLIVTLTDISGKIIIHKELVQQTNNTWQLKLNEKPASGVYFLTVSGKGIKRSIKLLSE